MPRREMVELAERLNAAIHWKDQFENPVIRRDAEARELWSKVYPSLSDGLPGLVGAVTGRAEAQVLRLAALYAVLDRSEFVRVQHLRAALGVWSYCEASAQYVFGGLVGRSLVDRVREALEQAGPIGMTLTEIRDYFDRHQSANQIQLALQQLASVDIIFSRQKRTNGRSSTVWFVTDATDRVED